MKCKSCGKNIDEKQNFCNECNSSLTEENKKEIFQKERNAEIISSVGVIIMYVSIIAFYLVTKAWFSEIEIPDEIAFNIYSLAILAPSISITIAIIQKSKYPNNNTIHLNLVLTILGFLLFVGILISSLIKCYNNLVEAMSHCG